jgi:hypothetical protein
MHPVDEVLRQARAVLGDMTLPQLPTRSGGNTAAVQAPSQWSGPAAESATAATDRLIEKHTQFHSVRAAATGVINQAASISQDAHTQLRTVEQAWASDKAAIGPYARTASGQAALLQAGQLRVQEATMVVQNAAERYGQAAQKITMLSGELPESGPGRDPLPQSPQPKDPPHGKDPRYWIDIDQLTYVPDGKLAPYGYQQVGPNLYHPMPGNPIGAAMPAAKFPLDADDLVHVSPGQLGPAMSKQILPGWFTHVPVQGEALPPPKAPIDIRDIVHVPAGQLAPYNYFEYLPGWFAP